MNVLFVDDDETVSRGVRMALEKQGHTCRTAGEGSEAVLLAKDGGYDVIVVDVGLPDMDGFQVIRQMRTVGVDTPLLLQSGLARGDLPEAAASLGVEDFLAKPFSLGQLVDQMAAAVSRSGQNMMAPPADPVVAAPDGSAAEANRRQRLRVRTAQAAVIMDGDRMVPCVIQNLSEGGAALRLSKAEESCPDQFTLKPFGGEPRSCAVRWRKADRLGVIFL